MNAIDMDDLKSRFKSVVGAGCSDVLKQAGFRKKGLRFARRRNLLHVAEVSKRKWSGPEFIGFDVHFGVYVPGTATWLNWVKGEPAFPSPIESSFMMNLNDLAKQPRRDAFKMLSDSPSPGVDDEALTNLISRELVECALPFFDQFSTIHDLISYLELWPKLRPCPSHPAMAWDQQFELGVLYSLAGDEAASLSHIREAYELANSAGVEYFANVYRKVLEQRLAMKG